MVSKFSTLLLHTSTYSEVCEDLEDIFVSIVVKTVATEPISAHNV